MTVEVPDELVARLRLTPDKVRADAAAGLYARGEATLGQAAELAGICQADMLHELGQRKICVNYGVEDFEHDLKMIEILHPELNKR